MKPDMCGAVLLLLCLTFAASTFGQTDVNGFYTIVGPKVLRPNSEYHVAVSTQGTVSPTTVVVEVGGKQDSGGALKVTQFVKVDPYSTKIVRLEIGDVGPGNYNLTARGSGGLEFVNSTALEYVHKSYSVFIQTDKAVYKPGHKVQFRAIVLNSHLKPTVTGALDIFITDGKGNRVKHWSRALTTRGVFASEFQLSESPVLGDWNVTVTVLDQVFHKTFLVAEYILPKFEVTVNVPEHSTFKQSVISATIHATYTYGKAVKGEATVAVYPTIFSGVLQPIYQHPSRKVIPIDGKASVQFDIVKDLNLNEDYERAITFEVTVEEALTGRSQNTSTLILLHKENYKMELIKASEYFKPGLKYSAFIKLSHHDGTPVHDDRNPVKVRHAFVDMNAKEDQYEEHKFTLQRNGLIPLVFYPPIENASSINIEAEYLGLKEGFSTISAANSPSNTFIQATVLTERPTVNKDIEIQVNSTESLQYVSYQVLGRGDVIVASTVQIPNAGQHTAIIRFLATYAMAPTAHVIVQFVKDDGEVIADAVDIELDGVLQNFINVDTSRNEAEPDTSVDINFEAKPNSYIGVTGIDQSVLLLRSGNDITQNNILDELRTYDNSDDNNYMSFFRNSADRRSTFWSPGSFTTHEAFDKSGAIVLTNGYVHKYEPWIYFRSNVMDDQDLNENIASLPSMMLDGADSSTVKVRKNFPETWLWESIEAGQDGRVSMRQTVPDTITSWVITAFSVDSLYGLGLLESPKKLRVFRPFFISVDLPYSVRRGEFVAIPVVVFNYLSKDVTADVTLENIGQFDFADYSNEVRDSKLELYRRKSLTIKANTGSPTSFLIKAKDLGYISIKLTATSKLAGDAIEKKLLVKPEGETIYKNQAFFVDLRKDTSFEKNITLNMPANIVPDSEFIEIGAVGDILGPSTMNLASLIQMPFGCGEQNMLNFVPNIVILDYLKNTRQLTTAVETKSLKYMETGYQQELTYRRSDGSFSAFGSADPSGSTWLTAYVVKSFRQAVPYIPIEEKVIDDGLQWLSNNQANNGSFPEVGKVSHSAMQGGSAKGLALTAYTLIAFLENQKGAPVYRNTINRAIDYLVRNLPGVEDPYALAICSYALHLADHPQKNVAFNLLELKATVVDEKKWWKRMDRPTDEKNPWIKEPNSVDVEMTAYALLTYLQRGLVEDGLPILHWLVSQQNEQGGFASSQDTVITLYALSQMAEKISPGSLKLTATFAYLRNGQSELRVTKDNAMVLQLIELPKSTRTVNITATGTGFAIVKVSYRYNVNVTGAWPLFTLDPQVDKNSDINHMQLSICSGFRGGNSSNMVVMEVTLPSGYTINNDALPSLRLSNNVKRVETKDGDSVVMLYFDKMTAEEYCPTISAYRTHKVAKQKPVPVTVYDYYDQSRRARVFYEPRVATPCDICEDSEDCSKVCATGIGSRSEEDGNSSGGASGSLFQGGVQLFIGSMATVLIINNYYN
ncbi:Alpha-2-macroglobulin, thiol-ester bond-forming,Alpha-macroglobulin, receptor-binding,Alpha-2- [Cinara cedri]|uniref:TEP1-F n=1 Tax=Cinara cedri TaxID=506608 RepID=A0A5E4NF62_9HEMI|nr:Alpha-2-macroglobulin, thiol-ester bond-forming,Alpha-macroglobulin, receptor-binding,Alpha-2- [Cinara cedri]